MSGCHNRKPFKPFMVCQDGWYQDGYTRTPRMVSVPFRMNPNCQYQFTELGKKDVGCLGCSQKEVIDENIKR
jgi:hypothetical protein